MSKCPVCGSPDHQLVYDLRDVEDSLHVPGRVVRCQDCPMWFKLVDTRDRIAAAYGEEYGNAPEVEQYMVSAVSRAFFRRALKGVEVRGERPRLLDIGTGLGTLLEVAAELGFSAEGIELCEPLAARARQRGMRVHNVAAETLDMNGSFDVVTLMDIIEHVPDPLALLAAARRALRPDGELVVYTPNHRGAVVVLARFLYGLGIHGPTRVIFGGNHVCFFDDRSLPRALQRAGFDLRALQLFPYDTKRPGEPISRRTLLAVGAIERLGQPFRRVFRMLAYARPGRDKPVRAVLPG